MAANSDSKAKTSFFEKLKRGFGQHHNRAKIFFVLLSAFLWFLTKLSREEGYIQEVQLPLHFVNHPMERELQSQSHTALTLKVKASGFSLLKYSFIALDGFRVDLSNQMENSSQQSYWRSSRMESQIRNALPEEFTLISMSPDTVFFEYDLLERKKVAVHVQLDKKFDRFTSLDGPPQIIPDSIYLVGRGSALRSIDSVLTERLTLTPEMSDTIRRKLALVTQLPEGVKSSVKSVRVRLHFAHKTEKQMERQVELRGLPDSLQVVLFPKKVKVQVQLDLNDYDKLREVEINPFVNIQEALEDSDTRFLMVRLEDLPPYVKQVSLEPKRVEFIITRK